jgi:hypothetical protein
MASGEVMSELLGSVDCAWYWEWVPNVGPDEPEHQAWTERITALFADWASDGLAAARRAWPKDAQAAFPVTADMVGQGMAELLLDRAGELPASARLVWGAASVAGRVRWAPVPVVMEFRQPQAEDPNYLMEVVGADGREGDARRPRVDYVTTAIGDGVRVSALARSPEGVAFGRVDAAMRLDIPPTDGTATVSIDVILTTQVFDFGLMAVIDAGVEQLMQVTADSCVPSAEGPPLLSFVPLAPEGQP